MRERGPAAFVLLVLVLAIGPAQAQQKPSDTKHRKLRKTIQTFFLVGPGLSTVVALCVTERQPGGSCRVGKALPRLAKEEAP